MAHAEIQVLVGPFSVIAYASRASEIGLHISRGRPDPLQVIGPE